MTIMPAEARDLPLIVEMKLRMFREVGSITLLRDGAETQIAQTYKSLYEQDLLRHFIAYEAGQPVACGGAVIKEDVPFCFFRDPRYGYVMDVYVLPGHRRQGLATRVVEATLNWLREQGVRQVKLKPSGPARGLYEKLGFRDDGEMSLWM